MAKPLSRSVLLCLLYITYNYCNAYKILIVFPIPYQSHRILGEGYVRLLSRAGHEITYITPFPMKNNPPGVRHIDASDNKRFLPVEAVFDLRAFLNPKSKSINLAHKFITYSDLANATLRVDSVQDLLGDTTEEFDVVIADWLYIEIYSGLAAVFNCPFIWAFPMEPDCLGVSLIDECLNPAYTLQYLSKEYNFNFWHRVQQLWMVTYLRFVKWTMQSYENQLYIDIFKNAVEKRGRTLAPYDEVKHNVSLVLGNSYISSGDAITLPQNYKFVGGYHIQEKMEPLPEAVQKIMDDAEHGVIYFSMGSMLRSSRLPGSLQRELLKVFGGLNQTVIWKFEEELSDVPKNVHILPWAPQTGILGHPNCVLLITHGGILTKHEALHYGVPMIGIPQFADQFKNVLSAERKGFAKKVDLFQDGPKKLDLAIREILENSSYRDRVKEYSFIHHNRPASPQKELVHWVEHIIKTRGAFHLRSPALSIPWYQKYYVDLAAMVLLLSIIIIKLYKQAWIIYKQYLKVKLL